jgi:phosphopantetheinyl transferase
MPLHSIKKNKDGSTIALWEITESEQTLREHCSLPSTVEAEMTFIANEQRRKERLAVHLLLNHLLRKKVYLSYQDNGRPFLQNEVGDISIAHTKRFVCIIYHPTEHVGIDIESTLRDFSVVEKKALSQTERNGLSAKHKNRQLCLLWCAKEALFKRIGENGTDFSKQLLIDRFVPHRKGKLSATYINKEQLSTGYKLRYRLVDDHAMVWIVSARVPAFRAKSHK